MLTGWQYHSDHPVTIGYLEGYYFTPSPVRFLFGLPSPFSDGKKHTQTDSYNSEQHPHTGYLLATPMTDDKPRDN
jgi:hypothetical protein